MRRSAVFVAVAACAALAACKKEEAPKPLPPDVYVVPVVKQDVPVGIEAVGQTRGSEEVEIRPRVSGYLQSIDFKEGQPVKKGQLLYVIDPRPFEAAVDQAKGALEQAKARLLKAQQDVARYTPLVEQKAVSKMELDNAHAAEQNAQGAVASAQGALKEAQVNLSYCRISAPTDGVAGISTKSVGNLVGASDAQPLTTVSKVDPIWVKISIPEAQYLQLAQRQAAKRAAGDTARRPIEMVLADGSVFPHPGAFRAMDARTDASTGTVSIDISFPNPDRILRAGQFARVRSVSEVLKGVLVVPQRAIQELQGVQRVAVVAAGDSVHFRTVKTGAKSGTVIVVTEGVSDGQMVIVEGLQRVREGLVVHAVPAPAGGDSAAAAAAPAADSAKKPATP